MRLCYLNNLIGMMIMLVPAMGYCLGDRQYDADAIITVRNGKPCFSYPDNTEKLFGYHLVISKNGLETESLWEIQIYNHNRKNLTEPNNSKNCIEYGVLNAGAEEKIKAQSLTYNTPYRVFIRIAESPAENGRYRNTRTFQKDFCLSHNEKGEALIVGASSEGKNIWQCQQGKRGFWQKIFGN